MKKKEILDIIVELTERQGTHILYVGQSAEGWEIRLKGGINTIRVLKKLNRKGINRKIRFDKVDCSCDVFLQEMVGDKFGDLLFITFTPWSSSSKTLKDENERRRFDRIGKCGCRENPHE